MLRTMQRIWNLERKGRSADRNGTRNCCMDTSVTQIHDVSIKWLYTVLSKSHIISIISHNLHFHPDEMNVRTLFSFSSHYHHSIITYGLDIG